MHMDTYTYVHMYMYARMHILYAYVEPYGGLHGYVYVYVRAHVYVRAYAHEPPGGLYFRLNLSKRQKVDESVCMPSESMESE